MHAPIYSDQFFISHSSPNLLLKCIKYSCLQNTEGKILFQKALKRISIIGLV